MDASFFFFNDTATTEIYTLSLHDALPICSALTMRGVQAARPSLYALRDELARVRVPVQARPAARTAMRSEEHTSELQSHLNLVCRLLLEKKKTQKTVVRDSTYFTYASGAI